MSTGDAAATPPRRLEFSSASGGASATASPGRGGDGGVSPNAAPRPSPSRVPPRSGIATPPSPRVAAWLALDDDAALSLWAANVALAVFAAAILAFNWFPPPPPPPPPSSSASLAASSPFPSITTRAAAAAAAGASSTAAAGARHGGRGAGSPGFVLGAIGWALSWFVGARAAVDEMARAAAFLQAGVVVGVAVGFFLWGRRGAATRRDDGDDAAKAAAAALRRHGGGRKVSAAAFERRAAAAHVRLFGVPLDGAPADATAATALPSTAAGLANAPVSATASAGARGTSEEGPTAAVRLLLAAVAERGAHRAAVRALLERSIRGAAAPASARDAF